MVTNYNTSLLIADLMLVVLMAAFIFIAWRSNPQFRGAREWFFAFTSASINILLFAVGPVAGSVLSRMILETLLIFTGMFCYLGCSRYAGREAVSYRIPGMLLIACVLVSSYFKEFEANARMGFLLSSLLTGGFCLAAGRKLWFGALSDHPIRYTLSLGIIMHGIFMIFRPLLFVPSVGALINVELSISSLDFILFQQIIVTPLLGLSVLLLINEDNARLLKVSAEYDSLTQARNRGSFLNCLQKAASLASRLRSPLTVLVIDLDHFKSINDRYGHHGGDMILKSFATIARSCLRNEDELGRVGGEEFAIFLVNASAEQGMLIAERLRASIEAAPVRIGNELVRYSASIGVANYDDKIGIDKILARADHALYSAKRNGRNRVELAAAGVN